jgi:CubicO group peptidase (beta-lactamase class C family)
MIHLPLEYISRLLQQEIIDHAVAPGAAACVAVRHSQRWLTYEGVAGCALPAGADTIDTGTLFDLASVTKSVVAFSTAYAVDAGLLTFSSRLLDLLPWSAETPAGRLDIELLLSHRAGLAAHLELFRSLREGGTLDPAALLREAAFAVRPDALSAIPADGFSPLYSDLGYLLVGSALEAVTGCALDAWIARVLHDVGLAGIVSARQAHDALSAAATEDVAFRGGLVRGQVHDENAWALSGTGCSGHAGLFGTAASVAQFGCLMLDLAQGRSSALSAPVVSTLLRQRPGGSLRAGFDSKGEGLTSVGSVLGARTFGHLGFTGTSLWCDPDAEVVVVLLTNRVCPSRENVKIRTARPVVHDALARFALTLRDSAPGPERVTGNA